MMNNSKPPQLIIRYRRVIIVVVLVLSVTSAFLITKLKINPDVFDNLPDDDPVAILFKKVGEEFGGNYNCIIGLEAENIYTPEVFRYIKTISDSLSGIEGTGSITSLINIIDIRGSEWGIEIGKLVDEYNLPVDKHELDSLRRYIESREFYKGSLVSADGTITVVSVRIQEGVNKIRVAAQIRKKVDSLNLPVKVYYGGTPFVIVAFGKSIQRDLLFLGPVSLLVILLVLFLGFRDIRGVVFPVTSVLLAILWTFGLMSLLNVEVSIITSIIPILLVAVGGAYTIHMINRIFETPAPTWHEAIVKGWSHITPPVCYASITDTFGFISFVFGSYLYLIRTFGIFTSVGILIALMLAIFLTPALMSLTGNNYIPAKQTQVRNLYLKQALDTIARQVTRRPGMIVAVWIVCIILLFTGVFRIERKVDFLSYLPARDPNRVTEKILRERLGGTNPVYVSVKGNILSPEGLRLVDSVESVLKANPNIVHSLSVSRLFKQMNDVMGEGMQVPDTQEKVDNLWFLIEGQDILHQLISEGGDEAIIQATFKTTDIHDCKAFHSETVALSLCSDERFTIQASGTPSIIVRLDDNLTQSLFRSLALAMVLVFLAVAVMLRSAVKSLIALVPILSTVLILFGFMGWMGIPLDIATTLVGSISIGIGIDYSIYFINSFYLARKEGFNTPEALSNTLSIAGKSITINVLAVTCGFLVLLLSRLSPLARFGLLVGMTMVTSGLGATTLLPSLLMLTRKDKKNNH